MSEYKIGDKVNYHTGFWGAEQGQRSPSWWPETKIGKIIEIRRDTILIEFKDKSRTWAEIEKVTRLEN